MTPEDEAKELRALLQRKTQGLEYAKKILTTHREDQEIIRIECIEKGIAVYENKEFKWVKTNKT